MGRQLPTRVGVGSGLGLAVRGSSVLSPPHRQVTAVGPWSALAFPTGMAWGWPGRVGGWRAAGRKAGGDPASCRQLGTCGLRDQLAPWVWGCG